MKHPLRSVIAVAVGILPTIAIVFQLQPVQAQNSTTQTCHRAINIESERVKPTSGDLRDFGVAYSDYEYDQYRRLPSGRTRDVIITIGGVHGGAAFGADVLNSPQLMRYVATTIIEACPSVGRVGFTISGGGGLDEYYGIMMDGQIEVIPCRYLRGPRRDMPVMQWGYRSCS